MFLAVPCPACGVTAGAACCIQVDCATNHTSTESSSRFRLLKRKGFPVLVGIRASAEADEVAEESPRVHETLAHQSVEHISQTFHL
jgi:hypothetical protein